MLVDSLTFELTNLAPVKGKEMKSKIQKKRAISETSIKNIGRVNFQIVYNILKIVKTKLRRQKLYFLLYISPL